MVQLQPNVTLTLKQLGPSGAVISAEQQAALDYSLQIKRVEAGLKSLTLWGKVTTLNGKDYLIAEGSNVPVQKDSIVVWNASYYYSQDAVKWIDLLPVDSTTAEKAKRIKSQLSGDPANNYPVEEKDPNAPPPEEGEEPKPLVYNITELQLLRLMIDDINASTGVIPTGYMVADANNHMVVHKLFPGASYPDKLESYMHRTVAPGGPTLAADLRGCWALQYDQFKGVATLRSLIWPGYFFFYNSQDHSWGSLYMGDGQRNNDLIFML